MSMYNDIVWWEQGNTKNVNIIQLQLRTMLADFRADVGHSWDLDQKRNGTELTLIKQTEIGTNLVNEWCSTFAESGHPKFRATIDLERGEWRSKEKEKKSIHFNSSDVTIELILRTVISDNQLRNHGAVAELCKELSKDSRVSGKPDANEYLESMVIRTEFPIADPHTIAELQGNLLQDYEKFSKLCSDAGLKIVEKGQFFLTVDEEEGPDEMKNRWRECTLPRSEEVSRVRGWILGKTKIGPVLDEGLSSSRTLRWGNIDRISVSRRNSFLSSNFERN